MSTPRTSVFRRALQVFPERIAVMSDQDLTRLMRELLRARAYRCGSPLNEIRVNTEDKAKDDGCDGWSARPEMQDDWLGEADTCWQFKAGRAGEPSQLAKEITKRIPKETLANGGRFVIVASGSTNGKKGEDDRLAKLTIEANANMIPTSRIEVIGSERLSNWCNEHPAVAAEWAGRPDGLWTFDDWSTSDPHQVPWQASVPVQQHFETLRADLDFATGSIHHIHIRGQPGVGKTRFALELCREAAWRHEVVYFPQATDSRLIELIDGAATDAGVQLVVVADEVQQEHLGHLRDSVGRCNGRVRLITIGHSPSTDPARIPAFPVEPLDSQVMGKVVKGQHSAMPPEHVEFVVRFSDGYVRLALLAAQAVAHSPTMDVWELLGRSEIRGFLDRMLGEDARRSLYVVAVLTRVGWTDDKQEEGEAVARHLGLEWNEVRTDVYSFNQRFGIAPRGGRYRYISPTPLGIYLAAEAWETYPDLLKSLPEALPSSSAKDAYYERLKSMASTPQARQHARKELSSFFRADDFVNDSAARRWSALSSADPDKAAQTIRRALGDASFDDRRRIGGSARREIVATLAGLSWSSSSFHDAVWALALLAEAENEPWSNNAFAEFVARFQIFLGGTAVPYLERLVVLDGLLAEERLSLTSLVVKALAQAGAEMATRREGSPASDELPEREWSPKTEKERVECVLTAIARLSDIANRGMAEMQDDLVVAARDFSIMLRDSSVRRHWADFLETVRATYPEARELLRRALADTIRDRKNRGDLPAEELEELERLHARFEEHTLSARLQQHVGQGTWDLEDLPDLRPLAKDLLSAPDVLAEHWPWLTSGDASDGWRLGEALASVDSEGELAEILPLLSGAGDDHRLLCSYISARRKALGDDWYDRWLTRQIASDPKPVSLLFNVVWRCGATAAIAAMVAETLHSDQVDPQVVSQLEFGDWGKDLGVGLMERVLRAMVDRGHRKTAIVVLGHRMGSRSAEATLWKPLALELVTASEIIRSRSSAGYFWRRIADALVADYPREIAAAVIREHADRESGTWFAQNATGLLHACVEHDPSGVWQVLQPYLSSLAEALLFSIGFPKSVLERMPMIEVEEWIAKLPGDRAVIVAGLAKDISTDETLASRLLGEYGDDERVASAFLSEYLSGFSAGPTSSHWDKLAESLNTVRERTKLPKLRRWASESARSLRNMAEREREREEEDFRWR